MTILVLPIFVSLVLVAGALLLFVQSVRSRTLEHADRLALAPLDDGPQPTTGDPESPPDKEEPS